MSHHVPGVVEGFGLPLDYSDGSQLGESPEERAAAGPSLEPNDKRDSRISLGEISAIGAVELVVHSALPSGTIPVDLLIACVGQELPAKA
jgi:hypothetical protein